MKIRKEFLPFSRPSIGEGEINKVVGCLKSGWITTGALCKEFEDNFCQLTTAAQAIALNSATAGMHLTLTALGIGEGDEVITPSMTFASTINMIALLGAVPVFVDIDPVFGNLNPDKIEAAITPQTTAILPVHVYGNPCDNDKIQLIAETYNLKVIYDAAHAFNVKKNDYSILNWGDLSILSFHATKVFNTFEGGAIVCKDPATKKEFFDNIQLQSRNGN